METSKSIRNKFLAVCLASLVFLTACSAVENVEQSPDPSADSNSSNSETFTSSEIMFAQMMIPHHQQALDMSEIALVVSQDTEVLALAAQIRDEQSPEISQMRSWLSSAGASEDMGHSSHGMDGMLSEEDMALLLEATGPEFDRLFLEGMISHHEGAISMAKMVLGSANPEVKALAETIVSSQQVQIDFMKTLLAR